MRTYCQYLAKIFTPPIQKLESIAEQLERSGTLNATSLAELQEIVQRVRNDPGWIVDAQSSRNLVHAAEVFGTMDLKASSSYLAGAAEALPGLIKDLGQVADRLDEARYPR
jgi:hypothetical protein